MGMGLKEDMDSDLDTFFDVEGFAVSAEVEIGSSRFIINGFLDAERQLFDVAESKMKTIKTSFTCKTVDARLLNKGNEIKANGVPYIVADKDLDNNGVTMIYLNEK